jgi:transcriptional regulator EpsA
VEKEMADIGTGIDPAANDARLVRGNGAPAAEAQSPAFREFEHMLELCPVEQNALSVEPLQLTPVDAGNLLRIIEASTKIRRHYELFHLLQGAVQSFIPHKLLISAWCNFQGSNVKLDVISPIIGVRTARVNGCGIDHLLKDLHMQWTENGRRAMVLSDADAKPITTSNCYCAIHSAMRRMESIVMHGVHNERDEIDSIYVAMNTEPIMQGRKNDYFLRMIEPLIAHIDVAFRKVVPLNTAPINARTGHLLKGGNLSMREHEIMSWIAEGKTNLQIAEVVGISSFTVKNHVQRIFRKLGATNRTQAVAKYRSASLRVRGESRAPLRAAMSVK